MRTAYVTYGRIRLRRGDDKKVTLAVGRGATSCRRMMPTSFRTLQFMCIGRPRVANANGLPTAPARWGGERRSTEMRFNDSADLIQRAAANDQHAWDTLVDLYVRLLWSIARAYRLNHADAADVVQTTWLRLAEHLERLRDPSSVTSWLTTTARHECIRVLRSAGRVIPIADHDRLAVNADQDLNPEEHVLLAERDRELWQAFARLPEASRRLLQVLIADGASYREVAAALDIPIGSIGPMRARALKRLRQELAGVAHDQVDRTESAPVKALERRTA
jgi:RNA polymerase sigma factor (sigma-70 family)